VNDQNEIPLRITLHRVPAGVAFALQRGESGVHGDVQLVQPARRDFDSLSFDFSVRVEQPDAILENRDRRNGSRRRPGVREPVVVD